ncbi:DUF4190 domain-containing protein [Cryptosporangium arvum]|uniref:DUF4190 domain-containing protein n=1 Tax=Cryptosporangium arvum TaxID=80871 RepID=UPI0004B3E9BC|nr:DUF4190 domain-containing protein [Cryptosporangium arvum]
MPTSPGAGRDRLAVVAVVLGVLGFIGGAPYLPIYGMNASLAAPSTAGSFLLAACSAAAVAIGAIALRRCERERRRGSGLALAGVVTGSLGLPGLIMLASLNNGVAGIFYATCWQ